MVNILEINSADIKSVDVSNNLFQTRENFADGNLSENKSDVTILILAYNNIEKTKRCVESVLRYTDKINYELLLIDNGSSDGTLDYFKSIQFEKKTIIHLTHNRGAAIPWEFISAGMISKYLVTLSNDLIVTKNWLVNLITIAESNPKIGMVNPVSSNVSNLQQIDLGFTNYEDMQNKAALYNNSDPHKWHERLRLITLGTLYKKECVYAIGLPLPDVGFAHNFVDDDITFRVRRAGYKAILACDTWIHHDDHKKNELTIEQAIKINRDLDVGRENFKTKYFGIDAWDDVNNYIKEYIDELDPESVCANDRILGIDVRCGTPILEIKNAIRKLDIYEADCYAFTSEGKYFIDLQTVCGANKVNCGDIKTFPSYYEKSFFNHIVIGNDINTYSNPFNVIKSAVGLLKDGGQLFFSVHNSLNIYAFLYSIGDTDIANPVHAINYTAEDFLRSLLKQGYRAKFLNAKYFNPRTISEELIERTKAALQKLSVKEMNETMLRLKAERFYFAIKK